MSQQGPWVLKSGRYAGQSLEQLMFKDPQFVHALTIRGSYNKSLVAHARWLWRVGKEKALFCPCGERAKYIVLYQDGTGDFSVFGAYCQSCAHSAGGNVLLPADFSAVLRVAPWGRKQILDFLKKSFGLNGRITAKRAFTFFAENGQ